MKVNIDVQFICIQKHAMRGIPSYIVNIVRSLIERNRNNYSLSFFDFNRERGNRNYIEEYLGAKVLQHTRLCECNTLSYKAIMQAGVSGDYSLYDSLSYNEYTGASADVFHFPSFQTIPANIDGCVVATIHDIIPVITASKKYNYEIMSARSKNAIKLLECNQDILIITDSQCTKNDLLNYSIISPDRVHVVPLAHDASAHYPEVNRPLLSSMGIKTPYLLYLGELDFRKGVVDILDAFEIIKPKYNEIKLVLAGKLEANVTPIHTRLSDYRYRDDVILPGFVSDEQKRALMSSAEVFLFPSEYEGFGLPVLEAMACGSPVITTNVSSLPEVGGDAAVYVSPNSPEQLAYEIGRLLDSKSLREEYRQKGFLNCKNFSWDKTAEMTEEVYRFAL